MTEPGNLQLVPVAMTVGRGVLRSSFQNQHLEKHEMKVQTQLKTGAVDGVVITDMAAVESSST